MSLRETATDDGVSDSPQGVKGSRFQAKGFLEHAAAVGHRRVIGPPLRLQGYGSLMKCRILLVAGLAFMAGCGGSVAAGNGADGGSGAGADDAAGTDAGEDACPPGSTVPDAAVFLCDAGPAGSAGCTSPLGDPNVVYPEGCMMLMPHRGAFCSGLCCGPLECTCQSFPGAPGPVFVCPD